MRACLHDRSDIMEVDFFGWHTALTIISHLLLHLFLSLIEPRALQVVMQICTLTYVSTGFVDVFEVFGVLCSLSSFVLSSHSHTWAWAWCKNNCHWRHFGDRAATIIGRSCCECPAGDVLEVGNAAGAGVTFWYTKHCMQCCIHIRSILWCNCFYWLEMCFLLLWHEESCSRAHYEDVRTFVYR